MTEQPAASPALFAAIGRIYLYCGHLEMASKYFHIVESHPKADEISKNMNRAIEAVAYGKYEEAVQILKRIMEIDPENAVVCFKSVSALLLQFA